MTALDTVDLTSALRTKDLLNWLRNLGVMLSSMLLILTVADRRLLVVVVVGLAASVWLARGSRAAAVALVLAAGIMAIFFERDYRRSMARIADRSAIETQADRQLQNLDRIFAAHSRFLSRSCVALGGLYLGALFLVVFYRRRAPQPRSELTWRQRLALRAALLRARMRPRAVLYFALALVCALIVLAPGLVVVLGMIFNVPHTDRTAPVFGWAGEVSWSRIVIAFSGVIGCLYFLTRSKRHAGLTVHRAEALDPRPPILLLRSFEDDTTPLQQTREQNSWMHSVIMPTVWTLEETVEKVLGARGPVIAIGRPGEPVPPAGAAREYLANDEWQDRVRELIEQAKLVAVILGDTEGLRFEYQTLLDQGASPKLILLFPPRGPEELKSRWSRFCDVFFPDGPPPEVDLSRSLAAKLPGEDTVIVITARRRDDEDCYRMALDYCLASQETQIQG